jgi:hypothetical protein
MSALLKRSVNKVQARQRRCHVSAQPKQTTQRERPRMSALLKRSVTKVQGRSAVVMFGRNQNRQLSAKGRA